MEEKRCLLIINPVSGTSSKEQVASATAEAISAAGMRLDTVYTRHAGHATELAATAAAQGTYAVIAAGGDGTVNETARALCGTDTALGIIPMGSGNGLARHLGIPVDVDRSLRVIAERNIINADYGTANDKPFFCTFGVGFDAAVSERFARQKRRGVMMYLKSAIDEYIKFNPEEYVIEANGRVLTERAFLVVCCNASQYGNNTFIAPRASITDHPALDIITRGHTVACDHCTVNGLPFFCTCGVGFDAAVSDGFASRPKNRGMINYMRSAVEQFVKYKSEHYVIRSEGHEIVEQAFLIACCNASQYGNNTFIAPRASITDGLMDVTVVHAGTRLGSFLTGIEIMAGTLGDSARVHTFRTSHLTIERTSPGSAHIDGEPVTLDRILEIRCHPATLKVFSPGEMRVRPIITPVDAAVKGIALTIGDMIHR